MCFQQRSDPVAQQGTKLLLQEFGDCWKSPFSCSPPFTQLNAPHDFSQAIRLKVKSFRRNFRTRMHLGAEKCNVCSLEDDVCHACRLVQEPQLREPAQNPIVCKAQGSCHTRENSVRYQVAHTEEQAQDLPLCETKGSYSPQPNRTAQQDGSGPSRTSKKQ